MIKRRLRLMQILPVLMLFTHCIKDGNDSVDEQTNPMEVIWEIQYDSYSWGAYAPPSVLHDSLLIYSGDGSINCVTVDSGEWRWSSDFSSAGFMHNRFVYDDTRLYGFEGKDKVFSIDIADGTTLWRTEIDSNWEFSFNTAIDNDYYYVGTNSLNKIKTIWKMRKDNGIIVDSLPTEYMPWSLVYSDNKLYSTFGWSPTGSPNIVGQIICYDEESLIELWRYDSPGSFSICYPVFENGIMYVGTVWGSNNKVIALDAETGDVIWENGSDDISAIKVLLAGEILYVEAGAAIYALNKATGFQLWRTNLPNPDESPSLSYWGGYIYVENFGTLFVLNAETGEIVHKGRGPDNASVEQVSAGAGKIFVQSTQHLYAFSPYDPEKDND